MIIDEDGNEKVMMTKRGEGGESGGNETADSENEKRSEGQEGSHYSGVGRDISPRQSIIGKLSRLRPLLDDLGTVLDGI